jgi:hypothetical protein
MRSPSENFIKFLISKKEFHSTQIIALLEDYALHHNVNADTIRTLTRRMGDIPEPDAIVSKNVVDQRLAKEWYRAQGILGLWLPNEDVRGAYTLLTQVQVRKNLEPLLLSPLRIEEITKRINKHHNLSITVTTVEAYGHYFWNKNLLSMQDWVAFMQLRGDAWSGIAALKASPDVASMVVPWVTGLSGPPPNLNTGIVARRMRDVAFMKVLETEREQASVDHSKMMKNYMDVIKASESEMRQSDVALKDVLKAFEKFRMKRDEGDVPSIEDVAGMNYSQSGGGTDGKSEDEVLLEEFTE